MKVNATRETPVCQYCNIPLVKDRTQWVHGNIWNREKPGDKTCDRRDLVDAGQIPKFEATPTIVMYKKEVEDDRE